MDIVSKIINSTGIFILDGGLATQLEARGADLKDPLWSARVLLEKPELIKEVHKSYFLSGADCATTATYQATPAGFMKRGLSFEKSADLLRFGIRLAREARDEAGKNLAVAASVGSYGAFLADGSEYRGRYGLTKAELLEFHRPRLEIFADLHKSGEFDLIAYETIPSLEEAEVLGAWADARRIPFWLSFSLKDAKHISDGTNLAAAVSAVAKFNSVVAVGVNCTSPENITGAIGELRSSTSKHIVVYPNSGEAYDAGSKSWNGVKSSVFAKADEWYQSGARLIGGCCRTTPADIHELSRLKKSPAG